MGRKFSFIPDWTLHVLNSATHRVLYLQALGGEVHRTCCYCEPPKLETAAEAKHLRRYQP